MIQPIAPMWLIMQETSHGPRYFLGGHPELVDNWTADMRKAHRFSWECAANIIENVGAHTYGAPVRKVRS